jgi:hypothetical protein
MSGVQSSGAVRVPERVHQDDDAGARGLSARTGREVADDIDVDDLFA